MDANERRQASVKQVQFLEIIEQRTGDKFQGTRWVASEVSEYLDTHTKKKDESSQPKQSNSFKASNPYNQYNNNQYNNKQSNKITDKQRQYIKVLENKTGAFFNGKTFEDAEAYIKEHKS